MPPPAEQRPPPENAPSPPAQAGPPAASGSAIRWAFLWANLRFPWLRMLGSRGGHRLQSARNVPDGFFGICVATTADPAGDDYIVQALRELRIRHVRLDYTYASEHGPTERFLERLLDEDFRVLLHLVQPLAQAQVMPANPARLEWRRFVARTLERHGARIEAVEIGATCNRRKWCGYSQPAFLDAWQLAHAEARARGLRVAAPNVTDFEPFYNIGLLALAARRGMLPDIQTDNLFAERATEPEAYDPKIIGHRLAPLLKVNTIKKAALLKRIGMRYRVSALMCTHVAWSERRIRRMLPDPWYKQADYLQRYLLLMAAADAFERVYWGPLIGQREGPIDDGTRDYPDLPHVTLYERALGVVADYRRRPAFEALRTTVAQLSGARFIRDHAQSPRLHVLEFCIPAPAAADNARTACLHAVWTTNGYGFDPASWYTPEALRRAQATGRDGMRLDSFPRIIGESPVFLRWDDPPAHRAHRPTHLPAHRFFATAGCIYRRVHTGDFQGVTASYADMAGLPATPSITPALLEQAPDRNLLRDKRNRVWSCRLGGETGIDVVVKRSWVRSPLRRILDRLKPSRPLRSWSSACELLRLGIPSPRPIAYFEATAAPHASPGYFVCEAVSANGSVRNAFYDFARGAVSYAGVAKAELYRTLAAFLRVMHHRGCFFRDLSAGNVLIQIAPDGIPQYTLIDTTRARFLPRGVRMAHRVSDLKRICHRLTWPERHAFLACYFSDRHGPPTLRIRLAFTLYDLKHALKQHMKRRAR
jgi:hypothetical protein